MTWFIKKSKQFNQSDIARDGHRSINADAQCKRARGASLADV